MFKVLIKKITSSSFLQNLYCWYLLLSESISYTFKNSKKYQKFLNYLKLKYLLNFNKKELDPKMYELTVFPEYAALRYYKSFMRGFFWSLILFYCYYSIPQSDGIKHIKKALKSFFLMLFF